MQRQGQFYQQHTAVNNDFFLLFNFNHNHTYTVRTCHKHIRAHESPNGNCLFFHQITQSTPQHRTMTMTAEKKKTHEFYSMTIVNH